MSMRQLFRVIVAGCALALGCGGDPPIKGEVVAQKMQSRFQIVSEDTNNVGLYLRYQGPQEVPRPSVRELQHARSAVVSSKRMEYYNYLPSESKNFLDEIQIYAENTLTKMGEPLDPPPIELTEEEEVEAVAIMRRYGPGTEGGGGGVDVSGINIELDLSETLSTIVDAIAGAVSGLGQAANQLHGAMLCMQELGRRVLPGVLQVLESDDVAVYACRADCIESSSVASAGWCFYRNEEFTSGGYAQVASRMRDHLTEMCSPIDAGDIERAGGCFYEIISVFGL